MSVITKEQAQKEVNSWLDSQDVSAESREDLQGSIDKIVEGMMNGKVVIDENNVLIQTLKFPIGTGDFAVSVLKYKGGIEIGDIQNRLIGVKAGDRYANVFAYISAATGESIELIRKMNTKDYSLSDSIVVFFML